MFTTEQIRQAHSKVKSGADFPAYVREIKALGVTRYETYVADGHTDYYGTNNYRTSTGTRYNALTIGETTDAAQFKAGLKTHQHGQSDYLTFIEMSAKSGIKKWDVCMEKMTCIYFDKADNEVLVEEIPQ